MKKSDALFLLTGFFLFVYLFVYLKLLTGVSVWINDLKSCFSVMHIDYFLLNHTNVFFYLFLFSVMTFYLIRMIFTAFQNINHFYTVKRSIDSLSVMRYKSIIVIDSENILSFNFSKNIVLSTGFLKKLGKNEKKAVYHHEQGHLKHLDAFRYLITDTIFSLLPKKLKNRLLKELVIMSEIYADRYALKKVSKETLLEAILKIKEFNLLQPSGYNFSESRFHFISEDRFPPLPKIWIIPLLILQLTAVLLYLYKTCFCGVMG